MKEQMLQYPRKLKNERGELVFDLHPAKMMLRHDVRNGRHEKMTPGQLQDSRAVYEPFFKEIFRQRIYQEVRYQKYCNWLEDKRTKKQQKFKLQKEEEAKKQIEKGKKETKKRQRRRNKLTSKSKSVKKKKKM